LQSQLEIKRTPPKLPIFSGLLRRQWLKGVVTVGLTASLVLATVLIVSPDARAQVQDLIVRFVEVDSPWARLPKAPDAEALRGAPLATRGVSPLPDLATAPGAALQSLPTPPDVSARALPDLARSPAARLPTGVPTPPGVPAPPRPERSAAARPEPALTSLEEAQANTSFTIKLPATLPEGYSFKGVLRTRTPPRLDEALPREGLPSLPAMVSLIFENGAGGRLMLSEASLPSLDLGDAAPRPGAPAAGEIRLPVGAGSVQEVSVNGQPGQYVAGAWSPQGWDADAGLNQLIWRGADGLNYMLLSPTLGLDDLLTTAQSIP
jgi:hypothetical protein